MVSAQFRKVTVAERGGRKAQFKMRNLKFKIEVEPPGKQVCGETPQTTRETRVLPLKWQQPTISATFERPAAPLGVGHAPDVFGETGCGL
jgi:hypothetical protein